MAFTLRIDGTEVFPLAGGAAGGALDGDWSQNGDGRLGFALKETGTGTLSWSYQVGDAVTLVDDVSGLTRFGGSIQTISVHEYTNNPDGTYTVIYGIACVDNSYIAKRRRINAVYTTELFEDIVDEIVTNFLNNEGVTTTNVKASGVSIQKAVFSYRTVADAFDALSEIMGYAWWIDADKDLHFVARGDVAGTYAITPTSRNFRTLSTDRKLTGYVNSWVVRGGQGITDAKTESLSGDGERRVFSLSFKVAEKPSAITIDRGAGPVAVDAADIGIKGLDTGKVIYWQKDNVEIEHDENETVLSATDIISVTYKGLFPIVVEAEDASAIAERAAVSAGTSGRYEGIETDVSIETTNAASDKAAGKLRRTSEIEQTIKLTTDDNTMYPGQLIPVELPELGINGDYLVDRVKAKDQGNFTLEYTVTLISGESRGGWESFWRRFTRPDSINVGDEFIVQLISLGSNLQFSMTETATSVDYFLRYDGNGGPYGMCEYGAP